MYLTFDQVILVADKRKLTPNDVYVYEREHRGQRILTTDNLARPGEPEPRLYGSLYFDTNDTPCVVPDEWTWDDAHLAKDFIPPEDPLEGVI